MFSGWLIIFYIAVTVPSLINFYKLSLVRDFLDGKKGTTKDHNFFHSVFKKPNWSLKHRKKIRISNPWLNPWLISARIIIP